MAEMIKVRERYSFINAWNSLDKDTQAKVKKDILDRIPSGRTKWFTLKRGYRRKNENDADRSILEISIIQDVFAKNGIKDCWD